MTRHVALALVLVSSAALGCHRQPPQAIVGVAMASNAHPALKLAVKDINAAGGADGVRIELVGLAWAEANKAYDPAVVLAWADRLVAIPDLVAVIGHSDSASTLSAAATYNRNGVPQLVTIATNRAITGIGAWTYRLCLSDASQGDALAEHAVTVWHKRRIAMIYVNDDYGRGLAERFEGRVRELGATIVGAIIHRNTLLADDEEMIRAGLEDMKANGAPDLIALFQRTGAALWTLQTIRNLDLRVDVLGSDNLAQSTFATGNPALTEGMRVSQFLDLDPSSPRAMKFAADIRAETGTEPDYGLAFAYDSMWLLRDAIAAGGGTRAGVKAYLDRLIRNRTVVHGVGGSFTIGTDHDARRPLHIAEIHDGHLHVLESIH